MSLATRVKNVRVQIGDANALAYTIENNKYTFAIKYFDTTVSAGNMSADIGRTAYFSLEENKNGTTIGHIYEYLSVSNVEIASVADFYITDSYVSVVGNKASGMVAFDGYICELYSVASGKLLGYEVRETLEVLGGDVTYNTLWLNLNSIGGINSIKYLPATKDEEAAFFVNGSSKAWSARKVGGLSLKTASRRFDIEFRTQYLYFYDSESEKYCTLAVEVPMLFVQEEYLTELVKDVKSENGIDITVNVSTVYLNKLMSDYSSFVDILIENKEKITVEAIKSYIGSKKVFS
jgi:hypothetical protein